MARRCIMVLGPPGSGKGTLCESLPEFEHISLGQMLRDVGHDSRNGELADDTLVSELLVNSLDNSTRDVLLDGFPRTKCQTFILDDILASRGIVPTVVIKLFAENDTLIRRLLARGRPDDTEDTILYRLSWHDEFSSIVETVYLLRGQLRRVCADRPASEVAEEVRGILRCYQKAINASCVYCGDLEGQCFCSTILLR